MENPRSRNHPSPHRRQKLLGPNGGALMCRSYGTTSSSSISLDPDVSPPRVTLFVARHARLAPAVDLPPFCQYGACRQEDSCEMANAAGFIVEEGPTHEILTWAPRFVFGSASSSSPRLAKRQQRGECDPGDSPCKLWKPRRQMLLLGE